MAAAPNTAPILLPVSFTTEAERAGFALNKPAKGGHFIIPFLWKELLAQYSVELLLHGQYVCMLEQPRAGLGLRWIPGRYHCLNQRLTEQEKEAVIREARALLAAWNKAFEARLPDLDAYLDETRALQRTWVWSSKHNDYAPV